MYVEITISSKDVLDYFIMSRRRNELEFKKNFLKVKGAKQSDPHIAVLETTIMNTDEAIKPLEEKMTMAGLKPITLYGTKIDKLNEKIHEYSIEEIMNAAKSKNGELYNNMKNRGEMAKKNFEYKEELSALTVILTTAGPVEAKEITEIVEGDKDEITMNLTPELKNKVQPLMERLGYKIENQGEYTIIKKEETNLQSKWVGNEKVWVEPEKLEDFEQNEEILDLVMKRLQFYTAKSQINEVNDEEQIKFKELQEEYAQRMMKREDLCFPAYTEVKTQVSLAENQK